MFIIETLEYHILITQVFISTNFQILIIIVLSNLSKLNLLGTRFCVRFIEVKFINISYSGAFFIVQFIHDSSLFRVWFRQVNYTASYNL
jgi:hypothetical protein